MLKKLLATVLFSTTVVLAGAQTSEHRARAAALVEKMTLEEKIDYIGGYNGFYIRSVERLGIPEIRMADGPQGVRNDTKSTLYPCGVAAAASWNPSLVRQMGEALGEDSRARGVHILLGPGVNIYRSPLCGRNFEYMGEDPYLSSRMAVEYIKGVQSRGVMATVKHFAANNQEYNRHHVSSDIDERTLNEIYFPAFKAAVQQGKVGAVMTSYNLLNGIHCSQNAYLINETLRGKWGFKGMVMSDWTSTYSPVPLVKGGLDLEMPRAFCYTSETLLPLVESGVVSESDIDAKVENILASLISFGFLDRPQKDESIPEDNPYSNEVALRIARESAVLLRNNGILPLDGRKKVVVTGPYAGMIPFGGGSGAVDPIHTVSLYEGLQTMGCYDLALIENPLDNASSLKNADAVILAVGFDKTTECEDHDRTFALPEDQLKLIDHVCANNSNVIVVVTSGGSVELASWQDRASAVIMGWYYGQMGGEALAEVISGRISPSGRLPMSMERVLEDNPCMASYYPDAAYTKRSAKSYPVVTYREGVFVGYRGYDRKGVAPLYPFGYGLTYGDFEYSGIKAVTKGEKVEVSFTLANKGFREAAEVVQLYVGEKNPSVPRPARELKQFAKVSLAPGESRQVSMTLDASAFCFYDVKTHSWKANSGTFTIEIAANAADIRLSTDYEYVTPADRKNIGIRYVDAVSLGVYGRIDDSAPLSFARVAPGVDFKDPTINRYAAYSTGVFVCFKTDSDKIRARWTTTARGAGNNMSAIGQKGLDLYIKDKGEWVFAGVGIPSISGNLNRHEGTLVADMAAGQKECLLYLPTFDSVYSLEIGVDKDASIVALDNPFRHKVVILGSSITHGASASRPGMAWPALFGRRNNLYCINMGFSGVCRLEKSYAEYLATVNADAFVLDAFSNPLADVIDERFDRFVDIIREAHPSTPLIFINTERRETRNFSLAMDKRERDKQDAARRVVSRRMKTDRNIYFIDSEGMLGHDHNATADGTHPDALGFDRMLGTIENKLKGILKKYGIK